MALIDLCGITKDYVLGQTVVQALRGIDLEIEDGEFTAIWGPSGSGKTTLLNVVGAIDSPSKGEVLIKGRDISELSDNMRSEFRNESVGFIFQGFNLVPVLTALENVMLPLEIRGKGQGESKARALKRLTEVGLQDLSGHRPNKLSGGQQQRVAIARALVNDPSIVIADEPTANLDSGTAHAIIDIMRRLNQKDGITFLFSTHDQRLLDRTERLIRLEDGRIVDQYGDL